MIIRNNKTTSALYKGTKEIVKRYKGTLKVYEAWKELTVSGVPPITLTKCKGVDLVEYKIYGNSYQETRSGKNLLKYPYYASLPTTQAGVTWDNDNGKIIASGTATGYSGFTLVRDIPVQANTNYRFYIVGTQSNVSIDITGTGTGLGINIPTTSLNNSGFVFNTGNATAITLNVKRLDNLPTSASFYPMLVIGTDTSTDYEPYVVMPSQDYPSEIESVGYKNLFSSEMELGSILGTGVLQVNTNCVRTKDYISITPNTSYNLSNDKSYTLNLYYYDKDKNFISSGSTSTGILTTPSNAYYLKTRTNSGTTQNDLSVKYMLTKGTKKYSYIPYSKYGIEVETTNEIDINTTTIVLKQPLRSLPNGIKDIAYIKNNRLYVDRYVGSVVLDGSENWKLYINTVHTFNLQMKQVIGKHGRGYCTHFKEIPASKFDVENGIYSVYTSSLIISHLESNTVEEFKTWLSTHNTQVDYELEKPYTEEFDEPYNILTFKGTTILSVNTNIQPSNVEVTYIGKQVR